MRWKAVDHCLKQFFHATQSCSRRQVGWYVHVLCMCLHCKKRMSWSYCSLNLRFCHLEPGLTPCISGCMQKEPLEASQFSRLTFQKLPGARLPWSIAILAWRTRCQIGRQSQISRQVGCSLYHILIDYITKHNRLNCIVLFINVIIHTDMWIFC